MKYFTLDYNMNAPTPKCIKVPVNSEYGVAVKVYKDGQKVNVKTDELSVNGQTASGQQNGFNIFELSSGSNAGMTNFDVDVQTGIYGQASNEVERINSSPRVQQIPIEVYLSSFISEPTYFKATDIRWTELLYKHASSSEEYPDDWSTYSTALASVNATIVVGDYVGYQEDYPNYDILGEQFRNKWAARGGSGTPIDEVLLYPNQRVYFTVAVGGRSKLKFKYTLTVDTHGVKAKFPLQVVQTDTNYFEI